jgi:hypothetical protein
MFMAIRCTSLEIVASYCLDRSLGAIDSPDFQHPFIVSLRASIPFFWVLKYLPWLTPIAMDPPGWLASKMTQLKSVFDFRHSLREEIDQILDRPEVLRKAEHPTVYQHLLAGVEEGGDDNDEKLARKARRDMTREDMFQEALALLIAGSDTVGNTTSVGVFHVLHNKPVLERLKAELRAAWPDPETPFDYTRLEKLPYLVSSLTLLSFLGHPKHAFPLVQTAVVKESLRLAHGVVSSIPRVVGPGDTIIAGVQVPNGVRCLLLPIALHVSVARLDMSRLSCLPA